ncbi:hypothetical protein QJS04_geneDACA010350 [Acorus gramineus]|uniref:Uncharacterized protein n=1 Tax=Acorus gramineus TaxID=55184 RepID=A0AAV9A4B5_ACOGR|nr:hypothetical protein QJS04_geneDACA010350 [Acorus gramineus]
MQNIDVHFPALERRKTRARAIALRQRSQGTETSPLNPRINNPITSEESSISGQATPPTENPQLSDIANPITSEESSISGQATPPTENPQLSDIANPITSEESSISGQATPPSENPPQSDVLDLTTSSPVATPTEQPAPPPPTTPIPTSLPAPLLDQATHNPTPVAPEKSLLISTKFREKKIVMENQKAKTTNAGVGNVKRRSTLMSMR